MQLWKTVRIWVQPRNYIRVKICQKTTVWEESITCQSHKIFIQGDSDMQKDNMSSGFLKVKNFLKIEVVDEKSETNS